MNGRIIGMLLFAQLAGLFVPFVLLLPLTTPPQDYLVNAVGASFPIKVAAFLLFANCALTIGINIAAFRVFRQYSEAVAPSSEERKTRHRVGARWSRSRVLADGSAWKCRDSS